MQRPYPTNNRALCLKITVQTKRPETIIIRVVDADPNYRGTMYEDRYQVVSKEDTFFVKMPISPQTALVQVFNAKNGNLSEGMDKSFLCKVEEVPLKYWMIPARINNARTRSFVQFAQEFCKDASIISAGFGQYPSSIYKSDDGNLRIDYYNVLLDQRSQKINPATGKMERNPNFGRIVTTPMRTDAENGVIEVSRRFILNYTVPMRMAILCHEYSHFYVNHRPEDEIEADLNALLIFLSLGYSKIAAHKAFLEVFKNADTQLNRERERRIKQFIDNFDNMVFRVAS